MKSEDVKAAVKLNVNPMDVLNMFNDLAKQYMDLERTREIERTKRAEIEKERQKTLAKIQVQKELFLRYIDKSFDERASNFNKFFEVIDSAMSDGNMEKLAMGLNSVMQLARESPFKALIDINTLSGQLESKEELDI